MLRLILGVAIMVLGLFLLLGQVIGLLPHGLGISLFSYVLAFVGMGIALYGAIRRGCRGW